MTHIQSNDVRFAMYAGACAAWNHGPRRSACRKVSPARASADGVLPPGVQLRVPRDKGSRQIEWTFVGPKQAVECVGAGRKALRWTTGIARRQKVVAAVKDAWCASAGAIPWLLLTAKSVVRGLVSNVTSVGARIPRAVSAASVAASCGGASARVEYTAHYYFYAVKAEARRASYNPAAVSTISQ